MPAATATNTAVAVVTAATAVVVTARETTAVKTAESIQAQADTNKAAKNSGGGGGGNNGGSGSGNRDGDGGVNATGGGGNGVGSGGGPTSELEAAYESVDFCALDFWDMETAANELAAPVRDEAEARLSGLLAALAEPVAQVSPVHFTLLFYFLKSVICELSWTNMKLLNTQLL